MCFTKKSYVKKCYKDYKLFIDPLDIKFLPNIKPTILKERDIIGYIPLAFVDKDEMISSIVDVRINPLLFKCDSQFKKSILFHEFTHILDANKICKNMSEANRESVLKLYSEYHASQVELFCNIGFANINKIEHIDIDTFYIYTESEKISVSKCYLYPLANAWKIIDKPPLNYLNMSAVDYFNKYQYFEANMMYYLGKRDGLILSSEKKIPNIAFKRLGEFATCIKNIHEAIIIKDFNSLPHLRNTLWHQFRNKYKCVNDKPLPLNL